MTVDRAGTALLCRQLYPGTYKVHRPMMGLTMLFVSWFNNVLRIGRKMMERLHML